VPNATPAALTALCLLVSLALAPARASARGPEDAGKTRPAPRNTTKATAAGKRPGPVQALGEAFRAFQAQDYARAHELASAIGQARLQNRDYVLYVRAQSAALLGKHGAALSDFRALARTGGSRFREVARWREADELWSLGRHGEAQRAYRALVADKRPQGDLGLARFRIAEADARKNDRRRAIAGLRAFLRAHPAHPLAPEADRRLLDLGGADAAALSARDRLARAEQLTAAHHWHRAIAELAMIGDDHDPELLRERDYWTAMTLFKMRRRYKDAGELFLRIYKDMGERAARALFHGARALSRADLDPEAIRWYQRVVAEYPRSLWAQEAQFLAGWLEFNMGNYKAALPHLETMLKRYGRSRWAGEARWFLGFSLYLLGRYQDSLEHFEVLGRQNDRLEGGQGRYWHARALERLDRKDQASREYRELVGRYPFSWYAHLSRARLAEQGIGIGPFGDKARDPDRAPALATEVDETLAGDPLIRAADELMVAGLDVEAGVELRRGEKSFLERHGRRRPAALAMLLDRYRRARNFNRPWMLAVVYGGQRALDAEPRGRARIWWEHAYPLAYRDHVERWRELGESPTYYLYAIMHKESGFDPHTLSYADAIGLLQMIPATTQRVVERLGMEYTRDLLYDPELNIKTGSWYIGRLLHKFKIQIPFGAGSFNSGPRPVMRWMDKYGHMPADEFVEMVPYRQTRGYMKKVTEIYSRYLYLYEGIVYDQPLVVDRDYLKNELIY
jgi:soluble lytic murein transglycosylase